MKLALKNDAIDYNQGDKMIVLKIALIIVGLMSSLFGYFIYFRAKYNLINDFKAEYEAGRKDEQYAKRVGLIEFVVGIVLLVTSIILIVFT